MVRLLTRLALALAGSVLLLIAFIPAADAGGTARALWVWNIRPLLTNPATQDQFFAFLAGPHGQTGNAITTVFCSGLSPDALNDPMSANRLGALIAHAHSAGVRVDFLCGDPTWAEPGNYPEALANLKAVIAYNLKSRLVARFDGFQFDVEPYSLAGWPSQSLEQGLLGLLDRANHTIRTADPQIQLSATIPFWYDKPEYGYLDRGVIERTDSVAIMDYTNSLSNLISFPAAEIAYASSQGKSAWIGVETNPQPSAPTTTFAALGDQALEEALAEALPHFAHQRAFAGYAIEDYLGYQALNP